MLKTPRDDERLENVKIQDSLLHPLECKFSTLDVADDSSFDQMGWCSKSYFKCGYSGGNKSSSTEPAHTAIPI